MIMTGYIYDAEGNRVAKGTITTMSCDPSVNGFTTQANYVRDQAGHQLSEFAPGQGGTMVWQHTNVYANGELIATEDSTEAHFYLNDWLGTRRVQTDYEGAVKEQTCSSLPYGDGESCQPTPTENLFTGKERDTESGNDYFGARYYASAMGRWMSPDWASDPTAVPYATYTDPQSLNLYEYVGNNPLAKPDLDGHGCPPSCPSLIGIITRRGWVAAAKNKYIQGTLLLAGAATAGPEVLAAAAEATTISEGMGVGVSALGVTGTAVSGTTVVVGAATHTNTDAATDMVTSVTNPIAGAAALATRSAKSGQQAADLATVVKAGIGVAKGKGVSNPAEVASSLGGAREAVNSAVSAVVSAVSGAIAPTPPPPNPPAPPPPPPCSVGTCTH